MDRNTNSWMRFAGNALVAVASLPMAGCGFSAQPVAVEQSAEPARLDLTGVRLTKLEPNTDRTIVHAGFPLWPSRKPATGRSTEAPPAPPTVSVPPAVTVPVYEARLQPPVAPSAPPLVETVAPTSPNQSLREAAELSEVTDEKEFFESGLPEVSATPSKPSAAPVSQPVPKAVAAPMSGSNPQPVTNFVPGRSNTTTAAVSRADELTRDGFRLAQKNAIFSARSQFLQALRMIAQANDEAHGSVQYTRSLNAGLKALEESHDFTVRRAGSTDEIDVAMIVAGHRTTALKDQDLSATSPMAARDRYQEYACEQFAAAMQGEQAGSMPLYGLGRVAAVGDASVASNSRGLMDAIVWHQASLNVDTNNFRAAHELGALYAKCGQYEQARDMLQRAVALGPHAIAWNNLAAVHMKLGEQDLANIALARARAISDPNAASDKIPPIEWLEAEKFAKSTGPNEVFFPQSNAPVTTSAPPSTNPGPRSAAKSEAAPGSSRFDWAKRR
jgi:tetratricopeptide (TPR) repeat protein